MNRGTTGNVGGVGGQQILDVGVQGSNPNLQNQNNNPSGIRVIGNNNQVLPPGQIERKS